MYYTGRSHGIDSRNSYWEAKVSEMLRESSAKQARLQAAASANRLEAKIKNDQLESLNTAAISKSERLLKQFANQCNHIARSAGVPTNPTGGVSTRVFERLLDRARKYARHADQARDAGLSCERQYLKTQQELSQ